MSNDNGESDVIPTESETTRTVGNGPRGSWEIPEASTSSDVDRSEKVRCHNADMHASGKSDSLVVPEKQANKAGQQTAAESVEERGLTKENVNQLLLVRTQCRVARSRGLLDVRKDFLCARDLIARDENSSISKVGAVCGSSARTDLCGGPPVRAVPTAILKRRDDDVGVGYQNAKTPTSR